MSQDRAAAIRGIVYTIVIPPFPSKVHKEESGTEASDGNSSDEDDSIDLSEYNCDGPRPLVPDTNPKNLRHRNRIFTKAISQLYRFLQSIELTNAPGLSLVIETTAPENTSVDIAEDGDQYVNNYHEPIIRAETIVFGSSFLSLRDDFVLPTVSRVDTLDLRGRSTCYNIDGETLVQIGSSFPDLENFWTEFSDMLYMFVDEHRLRRYRE